METIYSDIAARTGGNIYIGVVGPVRTGKSTLIKRIMETLVIPNTVTYISSCIFGECTNFTDIYFTGTEEEWNNIEIDSYGNEVLQNATKHYNYAG